VGSDNPSGDPDNQQGRLEAYLSGFADGEGTFSIGLTRRPDLPFGFQIVPEFRVSQNGERITVLQVFQATLGCGRLIENDRQRLNDHTFVLVVRRRSDLQNRVVPFFRRNPLISEKRNDFESFATLVMAMADGEHRYRTGFERLVRLAFETNGAGRYRRWQLNEVLYPPEPSETVRRTPRGGVKIQSELHGDMQSQAEMTWPPDLIRE
jgi:hypothetical protein